MPTPVHPYSEYGVALRTLKNSQTWLARGLVICVIVQFLGFALLWWNKKPFATSLPTPASTLPSAERTGFDNLQEHLSGTQSSDPLFPGTDLGRKYGIHKEWDGTYNWVVPITQILSLMAVCSQVIIIFLTLLLVLIAQAPGVVHATRALIWSILLLCMAMPWQYLGSNFPFHGVFYGYEDMLRLIGPHLPKSVEKTYVAHKLLIYARFIAWPLLSMVVLLIVSERFRAGIMLAVGHPLQSMMHGRPGATPTTAGTPARKIG